MIQAQNRIYKWLHKLNGVYMNDFHLNEPYVSNRSGTKDGGGKEDKIDEINM